jgi:hypothetical protein
MTEAENSLNLMLPLQMQAEGKCKIYHNYERSIITCYLRILEILHSQALMHFVRWDIREFHAVRRIALAVGESLIGKSTHRALRTSSNSNELREFKITPLRARTIGKLAFS